MKMQLCMICLDPDLPFYNFGAPWIDDSQPHKIGLSTKSSITLKLQNVWSGKTSAMT